MPPQKKTTRGIQKQRSSDTPLPQAPPACPTRLHAAAAGLTALGLPCDPAKWADQAAELQAVLAKDGGRTTKGTKGGARGGPPPKDSGRALQLAVNDLEAAIGQFAAAVAGLEAQNEQIAAGDFAAALIVGKTSPKKKRGLGDVDPVDAPLARRQPKVPARLAQFETESVVGRGDDKGEDEGKRRRKMPGWLAKDS